MQSTNYYYHVLLVYNYKYHHIIHLYLFVCLILFIYLYDDICGMSALFVFGYFVCYYQNKLIIVVGLM